MEAKMMTLEEAAWAIAERLQNTKPRQRQFNLPKPEIRLTFANSGCLKGDSMFGLFVNAYERQCCVVVEYITGPPRTGTIVEVSPALGFRVEVDGIWHSIKHVVSIKRAEVPTTNSCGPHCTFPWKCYYSGKIEVCPAYDSLTRKHTFATNPRTRI